MKTFAVDETSVSGYVSLKFSTFLRYLIMESNTPCTLGIYITTCWAMRLRFKWYEIRCLDVLVHLVFLSSMHLRFAVFFVDQFDALIFCQTYVSLQHCDLYLILQFDVSAEYVLSIDDWDNTNWYWSVQLLAGFCCEECPAEAHKPDPGSTWYWQNCYFCGHCVSHG